MIPTYQVKDWNKHYENNRSRLISDLTWLPIPNGHDGEGYCIVMAHQRAAEIFSAWILILQVASRCSPRGLLVRENGKPLDAATLAMRTRAKTDWFEMAFPILLEIGWLEQVAQSDVQVTPKCVSTVDEGRKEGIEGKKEESDAHSPDAHVPSVDEVVYCSMAANKGIPADYCREFHAKKTERHTWLASGRLVLWQSQLGRYWEADKTDWMKGIRHGKNSSSNYTDRHDRVKGTANEGRASHYRGIGKVP